MHQFHGTLTDMRSASFRRPRHTKLIFASILALVACSADQDSALLREVAAARAEINDDVERACGATAADVRAADQDGVEGGPVAACLTELRVEFDACTRKALNKHPSQARSLLACIRRDRRLLVDCCSAEGACSYEGVEQCYQTLWAGEQRGECEVDTAPIDAAVDACHAREDGDSAFRDPCADATFRSIPFEAHTEFGASPAEALSQYAGSCSAIYRLQSLGGSWTTTVPEVAEGDIEIAIELDPSSARFVTPSSKGSERGCARHIEVRMTAHVRTSDGLLDEQARGLLAYDQKGVMIPSSAQQTSSESMFSLSVAEDEIAGSLALSSKERGALMLQLSPRPLSVACEGSIWVVRDDRGASGGSTKVGWWSPSGCRPDYLPNTCAVEFKGVRAAPAASR